jgi:hypothetical protein
MRMPLSLVMWLLALPALAQSQPALAPVQEGPRQNQNSDPTYLTTQAQERAIAALRELLETKVLSVEKNLQQQKDTLDHTDARLILRLDGIPLEMAAQTASLHRLIEQRFTGVDQQFRERDERVNQIAILNNVALQAALSAAKEAVAKQESNTTKQIDQLYLNSSTVTKSQEVQINDLKAQLATIDGRSRGVGDSWVIVFGIGGSVIGVVGLFLSFRQHTSPQYPPLPQYPPQYPYPPQQVAAVPVVTVPVNGH